MNIQGIPVVLITDHRKKNNNKNQQSIEHTKNGWGKINNTHVYLYKTAMRNDETASTPKSHLKKKQNKEFKKFKAMACQQLK